MSDDDNATPQGDLVGRRIASHLRGPEDRLRRGEAADLATMEVTSAHTMLALGATTGRWPVRAIRRTLFRLLFPVLKEQSTYAETTTRVVTQLAGRLSVMERNAVVNAPSGQDGRRDDRVSMLELEAQFRGSEDLITERQARYVALFADHAPVLDIGCGRGEFLRLLRHDSIDASGIDLDPDMVEHCRSQGLAVDRRDALGHLRTLERESVGGIFSAQVIEHMAPETVIALVSLAADRLRPGGLLLLESVNPLSFAALSNFYLDFTHCRPYDVRAMVFLLSSRGFVNVRSELLASSEYRDRLLAALEASLPETEDVQAVASDVADKLYGPQNYAVWG